jgi:hypothetical protein
VTLSLAAGSDARRLGTLASEMIADAVAELASAIRATQAKDPITAAVRMDALARN